MNDEQIWFLSHNNDITKKEIVSFSLQLLKDEAIKIYGKDIIFKSNNKDNDDFSIMKDKIEIGFIDIIDFIKGKI